MANKETPLSDKAKELLKVLKESDKPMTAHDFKEMGISANGSSFKALERRGLVESQVVEITETKKRKVNAYSLVETETEENEENETE
ncbi:MAG: hypothetical protein ACOCRX_04745 [Candidatus Woesearchaeota archaeon]